MSAKGPAATEVRMRVLRNCCEGEGGLGDMAQTRACCGGFERRYKTKEEKVAGLKEYLSDLEAEASAVREAIADLNPA